MFIFQSTREKCEISRFSLGCWSPVMKNWTHQETTVKIMFFLLSTFPPIFLIYTISIMIHIKTPYLSRVQLFYFNVSVKSCILCTLSTKFPSTKPVRSSFVLFPSRFIYTTTATTINPLLFFLMSVITKCYDSYDHNILITVSWIYIRKIMLDDYTTNCVHAE